MFASSSVRVHPVRGVAGLSQTRAAADRDRGCVPCGRAS